MICRKVPYIHTCCWQPDPNVIRTIELFELKPDVFGDYFNIGVYYQPCSPDQKTNFRTYLFNIKTQEITQISIYSTTLHNKTYWENEGNITEASNHPVDPNYKQFHATLLDAIQNGIVDNLA